MTSLTMSQREALRVKGFVPTVKAFLGSELPWLFNLIMAHLLFWLYGAPALIEYGYSDLSQNSSGGIPSGPAGSGVGIVTGLLMALGTCIVAVKAVSFFSCTFYVLGLNPWIAIATKMFSALFHARSVASIGSRPSLLSFVSVSLYILLLG
ncbi:unnamed protein product [Discosporangium mesarthrocarpum]